MTYFTDVKTSIWALTETLLQGWLCISRTFCFEAIFTRFPTADRTL